MPFHKDACTHTHTRCHTLALVQPSGKVYGFGLATSGQLGAGPAEKTATPTLVRGQWLSCETRTGVVRGELGEGGSVVRGGLGEGGSVVRGELGEGGSVVRGELGEGVTGGMVVRELFAGGDQSFATLVVPREQVRETYSSDVNFHRPHSYFSVRIETGCTICTQLKKGFIFSF